MDENDIEKSYNAASDILKHEKSDLEYIDLALHYLWKVCQAIEVYHSERTFYYYNLYGRLQRHRLRVRLDRHEVKQRTRVPRLHNGETQQLLAELKTIEHVRERPLGTPVLTHEFTEETPRSPSLENSTTLRLLQEMEHI